MKRNAKDILFLQRKRSMAAQLVLMLAIFIAQPNFSYGMNRTSPQKDVLGNSSKFLRKLLDYNLKNTTETAAFNACMSECQAIVGGARPLSVSPRLLASLARISTTIGPSKTHVTALDSVINLQKVASEILQCDQQGDMPDNPDHCRLAVLLKSQLSRLVGFLHSSRGSDSTSLHSGEFAGLERRHVFPGSGSGEKAPTVCPSYATCTSDRFNVTDLKVFADLAKDVTRISMQLANILELCSTTRLPGEHRWCVSNSSTRNDIRTDRNDSVSTFLKMCDKTAKAISRVAEENVVFVDFSERLSAIFNRVSAIERWASRQYYFHFYDENLEGKVHRSREAAMTKDDKKTKAILEKGVCFVLLNGLQASKTRCYGCEGEKACDGYDEMVCTCQHFKSAQTWSNRSDVTSTHLLSTLVNATCYPHLSQSNKTVTNCVNPGTNFACPRTGSIDLTRG